MKTITVKAPADLDCDIQKWEAQYQVSGSGDAKLIAIESRSAIDVIVAKISRDTFIGLQTDYFISSPNFEVAIPSIPTLLETNWIMERLIYANMPTPDAVTIAQVLQDMGDF